MSDYGMTNVEFSPTADNSAPIFFAIEKLLVKLRRGNDSSVATCQRILFLINTVLTD
jgi:hypothetical protein